MGRKPDPRGKDRPRTIVLAGDVAEIAQDLADKSQLSAVISDLLRRAYGGGTHLNDLKRELQATTTLRKDMQEQEEELIRRIDVAEQELITQRSHLLPSLYMREGVLTERIQRLEKKIHATLNPRDSHVVQKQIDETKIQLQDVYEQIKELEE